MRQQLVCLLSHFTEQLFQFTDSPKKLSYQKFVREMLEGMLGSRSTVVANVGRWLNEPTALTHTEKRLCRMLNSRDLPWEELRERSVELSSFRVKSQDVIAFDPGDVAKPYAKKMENLHPVHDGSRNQIVPGYEEIGIEAIHWEGRKKHHIPLYQKLTSARCDDYVSQNHQLIEAIRRTHAYLGPRGIWVFDRGHDRSRILSVLCELKDLRWVVRMKENRTLILEGGRPENLRDVVARIPLNEGPMQFTFPKYTGQYWLGWTSVRLPKPIDPLQRPLTLGVAHDRRNETPLVWVSPLPVTSKEQAIVVLGYYLERWGKEEGYRFSKSFLNLENLRTLNWRAISNLSLFVHWAYSFLSRWYQSAPEPIDALMEKRLKHFRPIEDIRYRYYRVGQLCQMLLWEKGGLPPTGLAMTEVG